jgi:hypothetical protein
MEQPIDTPNTTELKPTTSQSIGSLEDNFFQLMGCPMAVCSCKDKKILTVNPAMAKLLEFTKFELQTGGYFTFTMSEEEQESTITQTFTKWVTFHLPDHTTKEIFCNCTLDAEKVRHH